MLNVLLDSDLCVWLCLSILLYACVCPCLAVCEIESLVPAPRNGLCMHLSQALLWLQSVLHVLLDHTPMHQVSQVLMIFIQTSFV